MAISIEQLVDQLASSGLVPRLELESFVERSGSLVSLVEALVAGQKLTAFQAGLAIDQGVEPLFYGEYVLTDRIGQGGMGVVYKAVHRRMKRVVALKMLPHESMRSATAVQRFYREVEAAARLAHPNIVTAYDAGEARGTHYLVMEFVDGADLSTIVRQRGRLPMHEAVDCVIQAARGLDFAHQNGVIHRDIKPSNMLLARDGTVKLLDMGLALLQEEEGGGLEVSITGEGRLLGTAEYMAPEQAVHAHDADHRSDIYSLGCTLYRLIAGAPPYTGRSAMEMALAHREKPIRKLRDAAGEVPVELEAVYIQMVAKQPDHRFQAMSQVVAALEELVTSGVVRRFERPKPASRVPEASLSATAVPLARPRRKKDGDPDAGASASGPIAPPASGSSDAIPVSGDATESVTAGRGHVSVSETTSGARGMLIDPSPLPPGSNSPRPTAAIAAGNRKRVVVAVAAIVALAMLALALTQLPRGGSQQDGGQGTPGVVAPPVDSPPVVPVVPVVKPPTVLEEWLDLLPLIDVAKDSVEGNWKLEKSRLWGGASTNHRIAVPVSLTGNYQLCLRAHWDLPGEGSIVLPLTADRSVALMLNGGTAPYKQSGLASVRGFVPFNSNNPTRSNWFVPVPRQQHEVLVTVRVAGDQADIAADVDGKPLVRWKGPQADLSLPWPWKLPYPASLGFITWTSGGSIRDAKLQMLDGGKVSLLRDAPKDVKLPAFAFSAGPEIDLIAISDLDRDTNYGKWKRTPHGLLSQSAALGTDRLIPPVEVTGDYDLSLTVSPCLDSQTVVTLPIGPSHATFTFHRAAGNRGGTGLELISGLGWSAAGNPTFQRHENIDFSVPHTFDISVRTTGDEARISACMDGKSVLSWQGPISKLTMYPRWVMPKANRLTLNVGLGKESGNVLYQRAVVRPMGGTVKPLRAVAAKDQWLDLLPLIDVTQDGKRGQWTQKAGELVAQEGNDRTFRIVAPAEVNGDYDLQWTVRSGEGCQMGVTMPVGEHYATFIYNLSKHRGACRAGLDQLDGRGFSAAANPTQVDLTDRQISANDDRSFEASVRVTGNTAAITIRMDGEALINWQGDISRLHEGRYWWQEKTPHRVQLGAMLLPTSGRVAYKAARIKPLGGGVKPLRPEAAKDQWLDLLPLIDVKRDAVAADWAIDAEGLKRTSAGSWPRIAVPVAPGDGGYRLRGVFSGAMRPDQVSALTLVLPVMGKTAVVDIDPGDHISLLWLTGIKKEDEKHPARFTTFAAQPGKLYNFETLVAQEGGDAKIVVTIDDKLVIQWKGPPAAFNVASWGLPDPRQIGIGGMASPRVLHELKLQTSGR